MLSSNRQMVRRATRSLQQNRFKLLRFLYTLKNLISDFNVNLPTSDQIIKTVTSLYADYLG